VEALLIDRNTAGAIFDFMGASLIKAKGNAERLVLTPASVEDDGIDPDDYDNDTDYLNAIPGMAEKLIRGMNTPLSECETVPEECFHV